MSSELNQLIENIQAIEDSNLLIQEIQKALKIIDSEKLEAYQRYYLKGFLWNWFPFDTIERNKNVVKYLEKSIELRQDYVYSKTELSFFYFDQKKYLKVIELLEGVDLSYFEKQGQLWKTLKLEELLAVSKLYLVKEIDRDLLNIFLVLISSYSLLPEEELAVPKELVNSVIENKHKKGMANIIKNVSSMIYSSNQRDYFKDNVRRKLREAEQDNALN